MAHSIPARSVDYKPRIWTTAFRLTSTHSEDEGLESIEASNADEAIRILETRTDIHIVFTDVDMPGAMDGLKLPGPSEVDGLRSRSS